MTETEEINELLRHSGESFNTLAHGQQVKDRKIDELDETFRNHMIGDCERYYPLMQELLCHERRDNIAGTEALFRLSWLHNVYMQLQTHVSGGIHFLLCQRYDAPWYHGGWAYFASCVICDKCGSFGLYSPICDGKVYPYQSSCKEGDYNKMKYFVTHYTDEWLYKEIKKELGKRIKVKERRARELANEVP